MPSKARRNLRRQPRPTHWADLVSTKTGRVSVHWYASGKDAEGALRGAAYRWRYEQIGSEPYLSPHNKNP
jgi:hypothetical protein